MHIKQIELFGFKSFVDKSTITFSTGICAVVGPNGCGKSNIVDAIRWVLGEQSAKQLRGKFMEEVIFSGTNGRSFLNLAEVSMVLSNEHGKIPPPYHDCSEIMVTRRLFRSGESDYLINKIPCRRMDIRRLFMDTGIAHRQYAIIEQGKISTVVESKPEEIRALIEEAAGITKFKIKKKAALRKIDLTKQNLLRLGDIIAEVSRQLSSLKRQAQRASRYRSMKKEIKKLEISRALHRYRQWRQEAELQENNLRAAEETQAERAAQIARLDVELTDQSDQIHQLEEGVQQSRQALFQIKHTISNDENSLLHLLRQLQELQERHERLGHEGLEQEERQRQLAAERDRLEEEQGQLAQASSQADELARNVNEKLHRQKTRLHDLNGQLDAWKTELVDLLGDMANVRNRHISACRRLEELEHRQQRQQHESQELQAEHALLLPKSQRLAEEIAAIRSRLENLAVEANALRQRVQELAQERDEYAGSMAALEGTYHQQKSQLQVLTEMERSYAWFNDSVKTLIHAREKEDLTCSILGAVAEMLEVDANHRQAVEAALGGRLQALVVDSQADAFTAMAHLKRTGKGRNYFIPKSVVAETMEPVPHNKGPVPLLHLVRPRPGCESIIHFLLSNVLYCEDWQQALTWWQKHPHTYILVTCEGDLLSRDGTFWGGSREQQISILEKQEERKSLEAEFLTTEKTLEAKRSSFRRIEVEFDQVTERVQETQANQHHLRDRLADLEKEHYRLESELKNSADRLAMLQMEKEQDEEEVYQLQGTRSQDERELKELEGRRQELEKRMAEAQEQRHELASLVDTLQEKGTAHQVSLSALKEKVEAARSSHERLVQYHAEGEQRLRQLTEERETCQQQIGQLKKERRAIQERLEQTQRLTVDGEENLKAEEERWREAQGRQHHLESRRRELLQQETEEERDFQGLRQQIAELTLKIQYLIRQTQERYHVDISNYALADSEEPPDLPALEEKLERLHDRLARIGEVNLVAIQEYDEQKQRHDFLTSQRDDLVQSLEGLTRAISRINKTTRRRFLQTLEDVNLKLAEVFPLLFNGGSGHLKLLNEGDPLETGIEILVHPPGKRLTSMSLLSGGEKALAAAALLFSLYMIRPSPFCILDEVDAPLDDANIDRFIKVLKRISQDSQIIMVTHNKRTMEISDRLLGVTMEEPGISKIMSVNFQGITDTHAQMV